MKLRTKLAYKVLPAECWGMLRHEIGMTRQRWANHLIPSRRRAALKVLNERELNVHLGCGSRIFAGWVNVDACPGKGVDLVWDLRERLPLRDDTAKLIYSEHVLEHLYKPEAVKLLNECVRILRPGGIMRLGVPDAAVYIQAYANREWAFFEELKHLGGAVEPLSSPIEVINQMFRMGGHHLFAWDFQSLSAILTKIGFLNVTRWNALESSRPELCLDDPAHAFETLYFECCK
jgi:predicted SAM-dependent methyltransferase